LEGTGKGGRPREEWRDKGEEDLNVVEISKQAGRPETVGNVGR